jgi:hypothetical protein
MNNAKKLYIAKQAGLLKSLANKVLGSRGQMGQIRKSPGGITPFMPHEPTLWGAKGLKGLTRPKFKQLKKPPTMEARRGYQGEQNASYGFANTLKNPMVDTPLAKLLQQLGIGTAAGGIAYGAKKGMDYEDENVPEYPPEPWYNDKGKASVNE